MATYSAFLQKHTKVPPLKCQLILSGAQFDVNLLNTLSIKSQVCICAAGGAQQYSQVYVHSMPLFQYVYMIRSEMLTKLCDIKSAQVQTCVCMFVRIAITSVCVHSSISVLCCSPPITSSLLRPPWEDVIGQSVRKLRLKTITQHRNGPRQMPPKANNVYLIGPQINSEETLLEGGGRREREKKKRRGGRGVRENDI